MSEEQQPEEPKKGRSNAIATYELLNGLDVKLERALVQLEALAAGRTDHELRIRQVEALSAGRTDHELRLRTVEDKLTALIAGLSASKGAVAAFWAVGSVIVATIVSVVVHFLPAHW